MVNPWIDACEVFNRKLLNLVYPGSWKIKPTSNSSTREIFITFRNIYKWETFHRSNKLLRTYEVPVGIKFKLIPPYGKLKFEKIEVCCNTISSPITRDIIRDDIIIKLAFLEQ